MCRQNSFQLLESLGREPAAGARCLLARSGRAAPRSREPARAEELGWEQGAKAEVASLSPALLQPAVLRPGLDLGFGSRLLPERLLPRAWLVALQQQPSDEASPGPCSRGR